MAAVEATLGEPQGEVRLTFHPGGYRSPIVRQLDARRHRQAGGGGEGMADAVVAELAGRRGIRSAAADENGFITIEVEDPGKIAGEVVRLGAAYAGQAGEAGRTWPRRPWPDRPRTYGNQGFVVRYAYSRAKAVQRRAQDLGVQPGEPRHLDDPRELRLLSALAELPTRVQQAARQKDSTRLKHHLGRLADSYHQVYEHCPALPVGDEETTGRHEARVTLAKATSIALGNGLQMIGEEPRERI